MVVPLLQELVRRGVSEGRRARAVLAGAIANVETAGARELRAPDETLVAVTDEDEAVVAKALVTYKLSKVRTD